MLIQVVAGGDGRSGSRGRGQRRLSGRAAGRRREIVGRGSLGGLRCAASLVCSGSCGTCSCARRGQAGHQELKPFPVAEAAHRDGRVPASCYAATSPFARLQAYDRNAAGAYPLQAGRVRGATAGRLLARRRQRRPAPWSPLRHERRSVRIRSDRAAVRSGSPGSGSLTRWIEKLRNQNSRGMIDRARPVVTGGTLPASFG